MLGSVAHQICDGMIDYFQYILWYCEEVFVLLKVFHNSVRQSAKCLQFLLGLRYQSEVKDELSYLVKVNSDHVEDIKIELNLVLFFVSYTSVHTMNE